MANRSRAGAVVSLALLDIFTLVAGLAVAGLLPARLALWQVARVSAAPEHPGQSVLSPAAARGPSPAAPAIARALTPLLASPALGPNPEAYVTDLATGRVLYARNSTVGSTPASSAKLVTAEAALTVLGPGARLATSVVAGASAGSIVLVGGGDPTLAAGHPPSPSYPEPATLASLAATTARWLHAHGRSAVHLSYDAALFTGPALAPGWTTQYVTTGNVTPISALEVDQGRLTASGAPQDADNPDNYRPRSMTPALEAADAFAGFLRARGVRVVGALTGTSHRPGTTVIARVQSPPVAAIVAQMLRESNNVIAEDLARQVALRTGYPASFAGAAAAVTAAVARLGVRGGIHLVDGSGLSPQDLITPRALVGLVTLAAAGRHPQLGRLIPGLPVAGFSGTLAPGQSVFGGFGRAALGRVRAKTGNLTRVASLTGLVTDSQGQVLVFAFMAHQFTPSNLINAATALDSMATALAGCGCR